MVQDEPEETERRMPAPAVAFRMLTKKAGRDDRSRAVQVRTMSEWDTFPLCILHPELVRH